MKALPRSLRIIILIAVGSIRVQGAPEPADQPAGYRLAIELKDGSRIIGKSREEHLQFRSDSLGEMKLPLEKIRSVEGLAQTNLAKLVTVKGDSLMVELAMKDIRVETAFGEVKLPVSLINSLRVSTPGKGRPMDGLIGWWPGNGNVLDSAGKDNGLLTGGVTFGPGVAEQAFVFAGNGSAVKLGDHTNLWLQNFTIEGWIKRDGNAIIADGADELFFGGSSGGYGFGLKSDGRLFLTQIDENNVTIEAGVADASWHHVAVTKSGGAVVFYLDGMAYPAGPYDPVFTFGGNFTIGARGDHLNSNFYGSIDELAVYNRALAGDEVAAIYAEHAAMVGSNAGILPRRQRTRLGFQNGLRPVVRDN